MVTQKCACRSDSEQHTPGTQTSPLLGSMHQEGETGEIYNSQAQSIGCWKYVYLFIVLEAFVFITCNFIGSIGIFDMHDYP